ncbi:MAG: stage III sporulation protein AH [Desulfitobacteriaceae bacterium]
MTKKLERRFSLSSSRKSNDEEKKEGTGLYSVFSNDKMLKLMVAAIVVSAGLIFWGKGSTPEITAVKPTVLNPPADSNKINSLERSLESKLAENLRQMDGVGKVQVSVSLASSLKSDYAKNANVTKRTTEETDKAGGTRKSTEVTENDQLVLPNGNAQPVVIMEERPEVAGVLVIAEGAKEPKVREAVYTAVRTLLNIPTSKITVVPMGGV